MDKSDAEIKTVWVVCGYRSLPEIEIAYSHAFATRAEALEMYRRGTAELPNIYWDIGNINYGHMEFANYMFDLLKEGENHE